MERRHNRRMRIKNKWEVVLVLTVIAAGIVITTVAAIKAREKRQTTLQDQDINADIQRNSETQGTESREVIITSQQPDGKSHAVTPSMPNRKQQFNSKNTRLQVNTPDYDVEYDNIRSISDEYTELPDLFEQNVRRVRIRPTSHLINHDNLAVHLNPPSDTITLANHNMNGIKLTKDDSRFGMKISNIGSPSSDSKKTEFDQRANGRGDASATNKDTSSQHTQSKVKPRDDNSEFFSSTPRSSNYMLQRMPAFADPLDVVLPNRDDSGIMTKQAKSHSDTNHDHDHDHDHQGYNNDQRNYFRVLAQEQPSSSNNNERIYDEPFSISEKESIHAFESAIPYYALSRQFSRPLPFRLPSGSYSRIPIPIRSILSSSKKRRKRSNDIKGYLKTFYNPRSKNKNDNKREQKVDQVISHPQLDQHAASSRVSPFLRNLRKFRSENREDSEEDEIENVSPNFNSNYNDLTDKYRPGSSSTRNQQKQPKHNNYHQEETRPLKYGILGSGNFEIIRGGIYSDEESASNSVPNYVHDVEQDRKHEPVVPKSNNHEPRHYDNHRQEQNEEPNERAIDEDEGNQNNFSPFNDEFFNGNPVLGFQGYDNFGAASFGKRTNGRAEARASQISERRLNNQNYFPKINFQDSAANNNFITISDPHDLDVAS